MIKFFRKIRQNLLSQNKIGKYLLYAFGEIILVIIGILIALNLNKQSEQKQVEAKIDAIMVDVLEELGSNIENTNAVINFFRTKDSVFYLVLNDKLTYDDYANPRIDGLFNATLQHPTMELDRYAFDNLVLNMDAIPSTYKGIVKELNSLHTVNKNIVDNITEIIRTMAYNNELERSAKYSWYSLQIPANENKGMIDYMLNDYIYKNKVENFKFNAINNHLSLTIAYRKKATDIYQKLAVLLDKPIIHKSFEIEKEIAELYVGEWERTKDDIKIKLAIENGRSYVYFNSDTIRNEQFVFYNKKLPSKKLSYSFASWNNTYYTNIIEGDTLFSKRNSGISKWTRIKD